MNDYELRQKQLDIEKSQATGTIIKWSTMAALIILVVVVAGMYGCPKYRVWQQGLEGQAELKRAEQNRQITIQEAMAKKESARSLAEADTLRAIGTARANTIIGESLKDNQAYLHWLWIDNIEKNPQAVIYVPTEANLPIMEATRLLPKISSVQPPTE